MEEPIAESLAESQKEISVAEFFERNRQMLGFDSSARSLITCVKEGIDNSLDACEEAGYLPDLYVEIQEKQDEYKVIIEDNGPGVIKKQIPKIFGKLLYGSRFHKFVQSLPPNEQITIKNPNGNIEIKEIGEFCKNKDQETKKTTGYKAPCFNRKTGQVQWREITHTIKHKNKNKIHEITTENGHKVKTTGNHSLFTIKNQEIQEVDASTLQPGDKIIMPRKIPPTNQKNQINLLDSITPAQLKQNQLKIKETTQKQNKTQTKQKYITTTRDQEKIPTTIKPPLLERLTRHLARYTEKQIENPRKLPVLERTAYTLTRQTNTIPQPIYQLHPKHQKQYLKHLTTKNNGWHTYQTTNQKLARHLTLLWKIQGAKTKITRQNQKTTVKAKLEPANTREKLLNELGIPRNLVRYTDQIINQENPEIDRYHTQKLKEQDLIKTTEEEDSLKKEPACQSKQNQDLKPTKKLKQIYREYRQLKGLGDLVLEEIGDVRPVGSDPDYVYDISVPGSGADENFIAGDSVFVKNSRGQQGIGISAAVLYGQLTTGKSARVISKISPDEPAHLYEININTDTNEPEITRDEIVDWTRPHGTRIEINMTGMYVKGRRQSIYNYLKTTGIANPHARITFIEPDGERTVFERAVNELPSQPEEIKPHPAGIELGTLLKMMRKTDSQKLNSFLKNEFTRVGKTTASEITEAAGLSPKTKTRDMGREEAKKLIKAFEEVNLISPPTDCLSPMGRDRIEKGLAKEYPEAEYISASTRSASVYSGNPFIVEAGIAYGIQKPEEEKVDILRLANRVPLLYQRGGCVTTKAIKDIDWRRYELNQSGGTGIPKGPAVIMVHVASTNVPFTSESKDAIANVEEIKNEVERAVREVGRDLRKYLKRQKRISQRKSKRDVIQKIIPDMAQKLQEITGKPTMNTEQVIAKINNNFLVTTDLKQNKDHYKATITLENHDRTKKEVTIQLPIQNRYIEATPEPQKNISEDHITLEWNRQLSSGEKDQLEIKLQSHEDRQPTINPMVRGVPKEILTVIGGNQDGRR